MGNKITLTYENGEFNVSINENIIYTDKDMESAVARFDVEVKNNTIEQSNTWDSIEKSVESYKVEEIEINSQFKTVSFGKMKYFYNTDKVFYIDNDNMIPLGAGYSLFDFILNKISEGKLTDEKSFLELYKIAMINEAIFRIYEDSIIISTPKFSYGTVEYNFMTKRISKGTRSDKGSFEEFKKYVLEILI